MMESQEQHCHVSKMAVLEDWWATLHTAANRAPSRMTVDVVTDRATDSEYYKRWHSVSDLAKLLSAKAEKFELVRERLQGRCVRRAYHAMLRSIYVASPMQIALRQNCAARPVLRQESIALRVIAFLRALHSCWEQLKRDIAPVATSRNVSYALQHQRG
jgi:hypothetical protein